MKVELVYAPGCPLADRARVTVQRCLDQLGLRAPVREVEAHDLPSPTVLVDGVDVMGQPPVPGRSCRLDVPTEDRILAEMREASTRGESARAQGENRGAGRVAGVGAGGVPRRAR